MFDGERQVAPDVSGIRRDHVARYEWAAGMLPKGCRVIDAACGIGYGSRILAEAGLTVVGVDRSDDAIGYAHAHYEHPNINQFVQADLSSVTAEMMGKFDAVVCFETIEHLGDPLPMLRAFHKSANRLLASVPNEECFPWQPGYQFHHRHYTRGQFESLLADAGWQIVGWYGQQGAFSDVEPNLNGRTCVVDAIRAPMEEEIDPVGHVAIVALGPSAEAYVDHVKRLGSRQAFADEVWAINGMGSVLDCDLVFHMDDVRIQEIRVAAKPQSNIANMLKWLRVTKTPVMTSFKHPDYPALVEFPLEDVVNFLGRGYFNGTAAYAVAYAIFKGAKKISLFGCDFTYPDAHKAEKGRGCLEFWLGFAAARGIEIAMPSNTSLMDTLEDQDEGDIPSYGYDAVKISCERDETGRMNLTFTPRDRLPTAQEIESAYDHGKHPLAQRRAKD